MSKKIAFIFPGQGAQYVGMGQDFFQQFSVAKQTFEEADDLLKMSLTKMIFEGPSEALIETRYSQIAIFVNSTALLNVLKSLYPELTPFVCAGLSLGEYTALHASEKLRFSDSLALVKARGQAMHEASCKNPGGLSVVLGLDESQVAPIIDEIEGVWVANLNCPKQVVISGTHEALQKAADRLKSVGAKRILPLEVSGAFHSGLMKEAREALEPLIKAAPIKTSSIHLVMNVPGNFVENPEEIKKYLIDQVISTTRWEKGVKVIQQAGIELFLEIGCGKTLSGMNKKMEISASTISLDKAQDLMEFEKALTSAPRT